MNEFYQANDNANETGGRNSQTRRWPWCFLAMTGSVVLLTASSFATAAEEKKSKDTGVLERMDRWQDRMTDTFRDTWQKLWGEKDSKALSERSLATASVDLREQKDSYTVRLNLPNRDLSKVDVTVEGDSLRIVAPAEEKAGRYEQVVALRGVAAGAQPKVERNPEDHLIVITVQKSGSAAKSESAVTIPDPALLPLSQWDREIFSRMERMQREMDRVFDEAFKEFKLEPSFHGFYDEPRFGSAIDLQEEDNSYVVRAYLPKRNIKNISVTVEGETLKIEAKEQEGKEKEGEAGVWHSKRTAAYSQLLTLPGPVDGDKMNVDRKEDMLVVTLPKQR